MALACILLAAGAGSRLGGGKQLALLAGRPLVRWAAEVALAADFDHLLVVGPPGERGEAVRAALSGLPVQFVTQPQPELGLLASFQVGLQALPEGLEGTALALADMPFVTLQTYQTLLGLHAQTRSPLVLTRYGGEVSAPPHLFRRDLFPELLALPAADRGPREVVRRYRGEAVISERPTEEGRDIDTPADLARAQQEWASGHSTRSDKG